MLYFLWKIHSFICTLSVVILSLFLLVGELGMQCKPFRSTLKGNQTLFIPVFLSFYNSFSLVFVRVAAGLDNFGILHVILFEEIKYILSRYF